jgi:hypothetical protein
MFTVVDTKVVKKTDAYLSFPDVIQSPKDPKQFFLVFREGDGHHPTWSNLVVMSSENHGDNWRTRKKIPLALAKHGAVWNCPRFYYNPWDGTLNIVCDAKSGTCEPSAAFTTYALTSSDGSKRFRMASTEIPGMVPDRAVTFQGKMFIANHKIKEDGKGLTQLVSWSRDRGKTWYDTNLLANSERFRFCEASLVNVRNQYLLAYIRDNTGHVRPLFRSTSKDGINWTVPEPMAVDGQRPTAMMWDDDTVVVAFRNTAEVQISVMYHNLKNDTINVTNVEGDYRCNLYNFGYTGLARNEAGELLVAYYIKGGSRHPHIKIARLKPNSEAGKFSPARRQGTSLFDRLLRL